jgi:hypothetical protein
MRYEHSVTSTRNINEKRQTRGMRPVHFGQPRIQPPFRGRSQFSEILMIAKRF